MGGTSRASTAVLRRQGEHFLEEERVSLRGLDDSPAGSLVEPVAVEEAADQLRALGFRERLEQNRGGVELSPRPAVPHVEKLRPCDADQEHGSVTNPICHVLDQVEEGGLAPMNVVEDDQERASPRNRLEQDPHRRGALGCADTELRQPNQLADAAGNKLPVFVSVKKRSNLRQTLRR